MRKALVVAAAVASTLAFVAAGCGGGGGGGALTAEEFASQLNDICADFNAKQDEIGEPQSIEDVAELGPQIIEAFDDAIDKVKDLNAPDELADQASRFVELGEEQRDLLNDVIDAAEDNDTAKIQELGTRGEELDAESDELATELGAPACAED